jgi:hypothetical protein
MSSWKMSGAKAHKMYAASTTVLSVTATIAASTFGAIKSRAIKISAPQIAMLFA